MPAEEGAHVLDDNLFLSDDGIDLQAHLRIADPENDHRAVVGAGRASEELADAPDRQKRLADSDPSYARRLDDVLLLRIDDALGKVQGYGEAVLLVTNEKRSRDGEREAT